MELSSIWGSRYRSYKIRCGIQEWLEAAMELSFIWGSTVVVAHKLENKTRDSCMDGVW
jgi:hypothetical protein